MISIQYSGMTELGTGNWVVLPDDYDKLMKSEEEVPESALVDTISINELLDSIKHLKYNANTSHFNMWMGLDCPFAGAWVIDIYDRRELFSKYFGNILVDASCD